MVEMGLGPSPSCRACEAGFSEFAEMKCLFSTDRTLASVWSNAPRRVRSVQAAGAQLARAHLCARCERPNAVRQRPVRVTSAARESSETRSVDRTLMCVWSPSTWRVRSLFLLSGPLLEMTRRSSCSVRWAEWAARSVRLRECVCVSDRTLVVRQVRCTCASGRSWPFGTWQVTVEIGRSSLNVDDTWTVQDDRTQGNVSGHIDLRVWSVQRVPLRVCNGSIF
jgi:hypothetical protein